MFKVFVQASTGRFHAEFSKGEDVMSMVRMVASGAQVSQGWGINISSDNGEVMANGRTVHGMVDTVSRVLSALEDMPARVRQPGEGYDVIVPVRLAMHDGQLVDAEDFVRGAVSKALDEYSNLQAVVEGKAPQFSYNGDPVTLGSAKEDRS